MALAMRNRIFAAAIVTRHHVDLGRAVIRNGPYTSWLAKVSYAALECRT